MKKRIYFKSIIVRNSFFRKVLNSYKFNKWNEIVSNLHISRIMLSKYRDGSLTIPELVYENFIKNFNEKDRRYFCSNIYYFDENWGKVKGGKSTYVKHKQIFESGRRIANENRRKNVMKFDINLLLTKELSYFIGLFIGDGFTNKYGPHYILQFTGDKRKEKYYYSEIISKITSNLFNLLPIIKEEIKTNALRVNFYSLNLYELIINRFKIKAGRKSKEVLIPEEILNSDKEILLSCIAGIYDAEGCFYFDNRKKYKFPYPAIALHMNNSQLIQQISNIFLRNKIKYSYTLNYSTLYIYGKTNVRLFLSKIKLLNPKYALKIEMLKKI
jgi:hypothetical protein